MRTSFIFHGGGRAGTPTDSAPNNPLLVSIPYRQSWQEGAGVSYALRTGYDPSTSVLGENITNPASTSEIKTLKDSPLSNYLLGKVVQEQKDIVFHAYKGGNPLPSDQGSLTPAFNRLTASLGTTTLPQNLHFFDLETPATSEEEIGGTLFVKSYPNYNFYLQNLEALDKNTPPALRNIAKPQDFYAYSSLLMREDPIKAGTYINETRWKQTKRIVDGFGGPSWENSPHWTPQVTKGKEKLKLDSFYSTYLSKENYNVDSVPTYGAEGTMNANYNSSAYIVGDDELLNRVSSHEKVLPYNFVVETNYNMIPQNTNNEFKKILKDMNMYETFVYNLVDRHNKPFFSLSDDGSVDFKEMSLSLQMGAQSQYEIPRAPLVAETLKFAFKGQGFIRPTNTSFNQTKRLRNWWQLQEYMAYQLLKLDPVAGGFGDFYEGIDEAYIRANGPGGTPDSAQTDFIYRDFNENTIISDFEAFIFTARLEEFLNKHYTPLTERVFDAKGKYRKAPLKNYVEVIAYSVERFRVTPDGGPGSKVFEKEYIFPASMNKEDLLKVVDSGPLYDEPYFYRFFCHVISVGTGVVDNDSSIPVQDAMFVGDENTAKLKAKFFSYPDLRVMKVLAWETTPNYIIDSMPVYPTAMVMPSRLDATKVKIVMSDNVPNAKDVFIPLLHTKHNGAKETELSVFSKIFQKQNKHELVADKDIIDVIQWIRNGELDPYDYESLHYKTNLSEKEIAALTNFQFSSKSPIVKYEIFRIDTPPKGYGDFAKAEVFELEKEQSTSLVDTITPNKTYYYTFRTINAHQYPSSPSPVIEVNVYDDGDIHVADVKPYSFVREINPVPVFEPLLSNGVVSVSLSHFDIKPKFEEKKNDTSIKLYNDIVLGWLPNTYYKIRVRSKTTGREMDLNFYPTTQKIDRVGSANQATAQIKAAGYSGGDFKELSNYFNLSTKGLKALIKGENETAVDPKLIEAIVEKVRNNKLDQQALDSLIANFSKLKSN